MARGNNRWYLQLFLLVRFERFVAVHRLWLGYMSELLALAPPPTNPEQDHNHAQAMPSVAAIHTRLVKAEFVGAMITGMSLQNIRKCSDAS